jgi:tetratricopeptide (TPR) repeat protein
MQSEFDKELQSYFTDVEHLRGMFKQWLAAPALPKRILVIHGVGGVGKSSLLRMFRLHCKSINVPVALASGDEDKSALEVLTRWADDLKTDGVPLPAFGKTFAQYRALQTKVENEAAKAAGKVTKEAAKMLVETAASTIPGIGPLVGKLGGMGAEALTDWLFSRGFKKPDVDLLLDPAKKLTDDFLADMANAADKRRIVLMLDTFEQMTALEDWTREIAQRVGQISNLPYGVLLVIAGRAVPNWDRTWHGWMANAQVEELKPMSEDKMRELIRRYYATLRGGEPDPKQVEAIIAFARGLPMVVTSAVQLWVKYGVEDFQAVKPEIVANLVDRLMEGVPKELAPALEAAAIVRWFDQPILRTVLQREDVREVYNELRRFPFVRTRAEGLALHDAVRDILDENLRVQDAERHRELHERAAAYFEKRLEKATGEEAERLSLERLYHRIRADEEAGIQLFQEMAEELVRYRLVNRLRALLNDVNTYRQSLEHENSRLWIEYYNATLMYLEWRSADAKKIYQTISENEQAAPKLKGYALCDLGTILKKTQFVTQPGGLEVLIWTIEESNRLLSESDSKRPLNLMSLAGAYRRIGNMDKALEYFKQALVLFEEHNDMYGVASVFSAMLDMFAVQGDWRKMQDARLNGLKSLPPIAKNSIVYGELWGSWAVAWAWAGRLTEAEQNARISLEIRRNVGEIEVVGPLRDLGFSLGMQGKYDESRQSFIEAIENFQHVHNREEDDGSLCFWGAVLLQKDMQLAEEYLKRSLAIRKDMQNIPGFPENYCWLGQLNELRCDWFQAEDCYHQSLEYRCTGRRYFECAALTGIIRVKHAQGDYAAIPPLLAEAEQLAQQYEYNDHLASLRLTQGHIAWVGNAPAWDNGFDAALRYYQQALIYALRYNRFLLDEVLSGRPQGTPLRPIIPYCLERGEEGRRMLIALRDWWQTGVNNIGTPRPDTISPIPEGIPLLEAERIAREREPGDGSPQTSVVERIQRVLQGMG